MKRKWLVCLGTLLIALTACENQDSYIYEGEGEDWDVEYTAHVEGETQEAHEYQLSYQGGEIPPTSVNYEINSVEVENAPVDQDGNVDTHEENCDKCNIRSVDEEIEVMIEWEDHTEELILENE
ncbi:hypothetical protein [Salsuginibacillus kocurii]|uniref:hypothetical protein n=1 Tax=Salsuginibacillus kocurii TaxID=427078 RepID=UPI000381F6D0|nr:hypothetical protein [Salsuginibacillus kocurii]